jgi:drug/metabolite transporter (DMT)-like permease
MPLSDNARGALFMSASMAGFIVNDAFMKAVLADLPLGQAVFLRGMIATALIACLAAVQGVILSHIARGDRGYLALRLVAEIGMTLCYLTALSRMPIANATAILQSMPLAVTLAAALFLGERVGWRRWSAIAIGFVGVLLIVRPGAGMDASVLWAVAALGFLVVRDIVTRLFSASLPSTFVAVLTAASITLVSGGLSALETWAPLQPWHWTYLVSTSGFLLIGYVFGIMTMRVGDVAFVSPFRYTMMLWAMVVGYVAFGDMPDSATIGGAAIIVSAGLFTFWREQAAARRAVSQSEVRRHRVKR